MGFGFGFTFVEGFESGRVKVNGCRQVWSRIWVGFRLEFQVGLGFVFWFRIRFGCGLRFGFGYGVRAGFGVGFGFGVRLGITSSSLSGSKSGLSSVSVHVWVRLQVPDQVRS